MIDTARIMRIALEEAHMDRLPADSEVFVAGDNLRRAMFGIDIDSGELAVAKQLGFDVVIAHHPSGGGTWARFPSVLERHIHIMKAAGVPDAAAREAVRLLKEEHGPRTHAMNYDRLPSIARMLRMPFMNIHAPADEVGRRLMHEAIATKVGPRASVARAMGALRLLREFSTALTPILVRVGRADTPLGKWVVSHGAGTNGGYPVASALYDAGVDTIFYIHIDAGHLKRIQDEYEGKGKKLVVTGHIASDSVGINAIIRRLRREGLEVAAMGGILE